MIIVSISMDFQNDPLLMERCAIEENDKVRSQIVQTIIMHRLKKRQVVK